MKCEKCGAELLENSKFCNECGEQVVVKPKDVICSKCCASLPVGTKFCNNCGESLIKKEEGTLAAQVVPTTESVPVLVASTGEEIKAQAVVSRPKTGSDDGQSFKERIEDTDFNLEALETIIEYNVSYYSSNFRKIKTTGKSDFNYSAFFLGPFIGLYRKSFGIFKALGSPFISAWIGFIIVANVFSLSQFDTTIFGVNFDANDFIFIFLYIIQGINSGFKFNAMYLEFCENEMKKTSYSQKHGTSITRVAIGVIAVFMSLFVVATIVQKVEDLVVENLNPIILTVKEGSLQAYPNITMEEMVDGFIGNPKWEAITASNGNQYVNISGEITQNNELVDMVLQFIITDTGFEFNAMEIDGEGQTYFMYLALISAMLEDVPSTLDEQSNIQEPTADDSSFSVDNLYGRWNHIFAENENGNVEWIVALVFDENGNVEWFNGPPSSSKDASGSGTYEYKNGVLSINIPTLYIYNSNIDAEESLGYGIVCDISIEETSDSIIFHYISGDALDTKTYGSYEFYHEDVRFID